MKGGYDSVATNREIQQIAYGQASLMLLESVMLALVEQRVLTADALVDAIETTISAKRDAVEQTEPAEIAHASIGLLSNIANSLAAANPRNGASMTDSMEN